MDPFQHMLPELGEVCHVQGTIGHDQELGQRELPLAQNPQAGGKGLSGVTVADPCCCQAVETGLSKGLQLVDSVHDKGKQGRQQFLQEITDKIIFLFGAANHGGRIDGIVTMVEMGRLENRVVMGQGVITVMVAERPFRPSQSGRHCPLDCKLHLCHQSVPTQRVFCHGQFFALEQGSQHQLGNVFGQGGNGGQHQGRWSTDEQGHIQGLVALLRSKVMVAAPLMDLPVDAGAGVVIALDTVHAQVMTPSVRMFGVDQGQGDKGAAIGMPGGEQGQLGQAGGLLQILQDRCGAAVLQADLHGLDGQWFCLPQGGEAGRH